MQLLNGWIQRWLGCGVRLSGIIGCVLFGLLANADTGRPGLPSGFVRLSDVAPTIRQEMRYATSFNFLGRPVAGYQAPVCVLTEKAANALALVQAEATQAGYSLKVYDCYRPQMAVDNFVAWAKQIDDQAMKRWFYPTVRKAYLFRDGYIAAKSGHSRGSTIDLTLVPRNAGAVLPTRHVADCRHPASFRFADDSLDMGTSFDCFDPLAHTDNPAVSKSARDNRMYLKQLMARHGFKNVPEEWWHYTLVDEPYPERYFNFPVTAQASQP
jgi:D-alanyl-D-alanine dipeptidase